MPKLEISIPHNLPKTEALERIKNFLPKLKEQHADRISDLEEFWSDNSGQFKFKISGSKISGKLIVDESVVLLKGDIPFVALPLKSKIESTIREKAEELLK